MIDVSPNTMKNVDLSLWLMIEIAKRNDFLKCYISRTSLHRALNRCHKNTKKNKDGRTSESDVTSPRKTDSTMNGKYHMNAIMC